MPPITADGLVAAPPQEVFAFLSRLDNHWRLADRWIEVEHLDVSSGAPTSADPDGGWVRIHGPLGVSRLARTRVLSADPPREICGSAAIGARTRARVRWVLAPENGATRVHLEAEVLDAGPLDRILLSLGGEAWLRRRFGSVLARLGELVAQPVPVPLAEPARERA